MRKLWLIVLVIVVLCLLVATGLAQEGAMDFGPGLWDMEGARVVEHLGRESLAGTAVLKEIVFENGVIEFDVAVSPGVRTYPGVLFRLQSEGEYERIYIRPHRAPLYADAIQYVAAFNGIDSWQLANGPGSTARAVIPAQEWIPVRVEVSGAQARFFIGPGPGPALVVPRLRHGSSKGRVGLMGPLDGTAFFSNFRVREDSGLSFDPAPPLDTPPGVVTDWEISPPVQAREIDPETYPGRAKLDSIAWRKVEAEADGLVDVSRYFGRTGAEPDVILARTVLRRDADSREKFLFGYSDEVRIFLDGAPVYCGDSTYTLRDSSFLGIVGPYDAVYLPLKRGANEILLVVTENMGGWGFLVRSGTAVLESPKIEKLWETGREFFVPESVALDPARSAVYVSNYDGFHPSQGRGMQSISRLTPDGAVESPKWIEGLNNPTGLAVWKDTLYAVEGTGIVEIEIPARKIVKRHPAPGAMFLNDLAVRENGDIYVTDSRKGVLFKFSNGACEEWLKGPEVAQPNGIHIRGNRLLWGNNGDGCLKAADLATKRVEILARLPPGTIDGIQSAPNGDTLVSHNEGRLYRIGPAGTVVKILDTSVVGLNLADFGYDGKSGLLVFPTFRAHKVVAYRLSE
jgi:sugar lactone lactonase YvrE